MVSTNWEGCMDTHQIVIVSTMSRSPQAGSRIMDTNGKQNNSS